LEYFKRVKGKFKGSFPVYDSVEELLQAEPTAVVLRKNPEFVPQVGAWFVYDDGKCAQIQSIPGKTFKTVLNYVVIYSIRKGYPISSKFKHLFADEDKLLRKRSKLDLRVVDRPKLKVLEDWLLHGLSITEAVKKNMGTFLYLTRDDKYSMGGYSRTKLKVFSYALISGPWFDQALAENRIFRDAYMSLINSLKTSGLDESYVATKIKAAIESGTERERINSLNQLIDLISSAEKSETTKKPSIISESQQPPMLEEFTDKETKQLMEHKLTIIQVTRSTNDESTTTTKQILDPKREVGGDQANKSEGNTAVPFESPDSEWTQSEESPFSEEEVRMIAQLKKDKKELQNVQDYQAKKAENS
jgi:hypothetical protein